MGKEDQIVKVERILKGEALLRLHFNKEVQVEDFTFLEIDENFASLMNTKFANLFSKKGSIVLNQLLPNWKLWTSFAQEAIQGGRTKEFVQRLQTGSYLSFTMVPLTDELVLLISRLMAQDEQVVLEETIRQEVLHLTKQTLADAEFAVSLLEYSKGHYHYLKVNAVFEELYQMKVLQGTPLNDVWHGEVLTRYQKKLDECLQKKQLVSFQYLIDEPTREKLYIRKYLIPLYGSGETSFILSFTENISEMMIYAEENHRLETRLSAMFQQHSAIQMMVDPRSGQILDMNPAACDFYGYSREDFLKRTLFDLNALPIDLVAEKEEMDRDGNLYLPARLHQMKSGEYRYMDIYARDVIVEDEEIRYTICFDVTEREELRRRLVSETELLETTLSCLSEGVISTDVNGMITNVNPMMELITGWTKNELLQQPFRTSLLLKNEATGKFLSNLVEQVLTKKNTKRLEGKIVLYDRNQQPVPISGTVAPLVNRAGEIQGTVAIIRDVTQEREYLEQIEFLSYRDSLTELYNRHYLDKVSKELDKESYFPMSIIMGDLNGLKLANDVFGHEIGDQMLKEVAELFKKKYVKRQLAFRLGGDEFLLLLPKTQLTDAEKLMQQIKNTKLPISNLSGLNASVSLGVSVRVSKEIRLIDALNEAEESMYHQKLLDGRSYRNSIINTLLATLQEKNSYNDEQVQRLERYGLALGEKLGLSTREKDDLLLLALLQDIGKSGIDSQVLKKQGPLNEREWEEMKRHPEIGYRIAHATPELSSIADLILAHHERWDGKGYPRNLKGEEIPLLCRILAIVDTYVAMTTDRAYRRALPRELVLAEIIGNAGMQFDPTLVDIFKTLDFDALDNKKGV